MRSGFVFVISLLGLSCGAPVAQADDAGTLRDAGVEELDAGTDAGSKASGCASLFGDALTNAFGRVDGVVTAVVTPADTQCPLPNSDHVVVQVRMDGGIYRMVVNVLSTKGDPDVRFLMQDGNLPPPAWQEGWHPGLAVDYATTLGVHSDAGFTPVSMAPLVSRVAEAITVGAHLSVYATSSGGSYASSAHLVHRNGNNHDGAIVVDPDGPRPRWLLFHFPQQVF